MSEWNISGQERGSILTPEQQAHQQRFGRSSALVFLSAPNTPSPGRHHGLLSEDTLLPLEHLVMLPSNPGLSALPKEVLLETVTTASRISQAVLASLS